MRLVEFEYEIGDQVEIIELNRTGRVCSLWCGDRGPQYEVVYWVDAERKKEYLFASEIQPVEKRNQKTGFQK